jgi:hypothetical protein
MAYKVTNIPSKYIGKYRNYWNYFNQDSNGVHPNTCCGQAAIFAALRTQGWTYKSSFSSFVSTYPPNNFFGTLGTSWQEIVRICAKNGFKTEQQEGEMKLRQTLKKGPAIVCLDVGAAGWGKWGLHWTAVFGYTSSHYYLTNWDGIDYRCTTENFLKGWNTWMTNTASQTSNWLFHPYK